jgi:cytoskeletal protein CcmA (bactofilin family)
MFSKGNKSAARRSTPSIIGTDCTFTGDIQSDGEVQVDGRLDGDVRCSNLVIGEKGSITGEIIADTVSVLGMVAGQITAQSVALARTARVLGDITHDSLSVEVGAYVEGRFNRRPDQTAAKAVEATNDAAPLRNATGQALLSHPKAVERADDSGEDTAKREPPAQKVVLLGS